MNYEKGIIDSTIEKLINGQDYRDEIIKSINASFLKFSIEFFKEIVAAKMESIDINVDWYKKHFIDKAKNTQNIQDILIYSGLNKKTINNIYGSTKKEIIIDAAEKNLNYLENLLNNLQETKEEGFCIEIKISYKNVSVNLTISESLIVINALATKKIQMRGSAWSSIGKKVEKPLIDKLCELVNVPKDYIDNSTFKKDKNKKVDREVDYKLKSLKGKVYRIEVKLMGKGNPESADATIARNSDIFIADTLSEQNKNQLSSLNILFLELRNNPNILENFKEILRKKDIPFENEKK